MAENKPAEAPFIAAIRTFGRTLADEFNAAAWNVLVSLAAGAAMVVTILTATAVSVCIGISFLAHGLHTTFQNLIGGWFADLATGIIMTALPLVAIAITRHQARSQPRPTPAPSPTPNTTP